METIRAILSTGGTARRLAIAALAGIALVGVWWFWPKKDDPDFDHAAIDAIVREGQKAWQVPGVAVAVVRDDRVVYLKGFGVREAGKPGPVTPDTIFPLASCTKAFTTTAMAMLVDEGKMDWDDPVRKHVPQFRLADPLANSKAVLRDLVTHHAGLGSNDFLWYRSPWSREEIVRRIGLVKPKYPFRDGFAYQSTMFTVAGMAVESASGQKWEKFVHQHICQPLGMKDVSFTTPEAWSNPNHAHPHRKGGDGIVRTIPGYVLERPEPSGSMYISARDLSHWLRFQLASGSFDGKQLVSPRNLEETHTPQTIIPFTGQARAMNPDSTQMNYGMAWVIQDYHDRLLVSHAGLIDGFRVHITLAPREKIGIVLLNNLDRTQMNVAVSNTILDHLLDLPRRDWNAYIHEQVDRSEQESESRMRELLAKRDPNAIPSRPLSDYAGAYVDPAYDVAHVALERGGLVWKWSTFTAALEHYQSDSFVIQNEAMGFPRVEFTLGPNGVPETMKVAAPLEVEFRRQKAGP